MYQTMWKKLGSPIFRMDGSFVLDCKISIIGISNPDEAALAGKRRVIDMTYTDETEGGCIRALKRDSTWCMLLKRSYHQDSLF